MNMNLNYHHISTNKIKPDTNQKQVTDYHWSKPKLKSNNKCGVMKKFIPKHNHDKPATTMTQREATLAKEKIFCILIDHFTLQQLTNVNKPVVYKNQNVSLFQNIF